MDLSSEAKKEVERLLADGSKIRAIQYLQSSFNITHEQAVQLISIVEAEASARRSVQPTSSTALDGELKMKVTQLLQNNQKIEAVKLVKNELNLSLKDSLVMVEEVHREVDPDHKEIRIGGGCLRDTFALVGLIFGLVSLLLLGISALIYYFQSESIENSVVVTGRVTEMIYGSSGTSAPVIGYRYNGKEYSHTSNTYSSPPAFHVGERVELYVEKDDPEEVVVNTFSERWLAITIIGGLGLFFGLFASVFFLVGRKTSTQP